MLVPFSELPEDARIWIYQSNRPFTNEEAAAVKAAGEAFLSGWTAHGNDLHSGVDMPYNRFIIFGLDWQQGGASGCSIDSSVRFIQSLETQYQVDLLDKMNVTYKQGPHVAHKTLIDFKKVAYCPDCSKEMEKLNACGAPSYFCHDCNELKSKSRAKTDFVEVNLS